MSVDKLSDLSGFWLGGRHPDGKSEACLPLRAKSKRRNFLLPPALTAASNRLDKLLAKLAADHQKNQIGPDLIGKKSTKGEVPPALFPYSRPASALAKSLPALNHAENSTIGDTSMRHPGARAARPFSRARGSFGRSSKRFAFGEDARLFDLSGESKKL